MELRIGKTLILDEAEMERLTAALPDGWGDPVYDALAGGEACDPWDVRTLFDITLRDALDEAAADSWAHRLFSPKCPAGTTSSSRSR